MQRLIKTLHRLVLADFKTTQKKFLDQGASKEEIKTYLKDFKDLRDQQKISDVNEKDIDYWGKKSWDDFKSFVDKAKSKKSKTKEKKLKKMEGAELVAENEGWKVYKIFNHKAARQYGSGTQWCITEEDGARWREYSQQASFYFLISKTLTRENPFYKIAVQQKDYETIYWDATDKSHRRLPDELNVPKYKYARFENTDTISIIKTIKESGITPEVSDEIVEMFGHRPIKYFPEAEFLAFGDAANLSKLAYYENNSTLKWNIGILNGDEFLDDATTQIDSGDIESILDTLEKKYSEMYNQLLTKLLSDSEFKEYMTDNYFFEENTTLEMLKENNAGDLNRRVSEFIVEQNDELHNVFTFAADDACKSATEGWLWDHLKQEIDGCEYIHIEGDYFLDDKAYLGVFLTSLGGMSSDVLDDIRQSIKKIGINRFDYVHPTEDQIIDHLIEYQLPEYLNS